MSTRLRPATVADADVIFRFICDLAAYEKEPDAVKTTPARIREQLASPRPPFECIIAEHTGKPAGFALFFQNYSTWRGVPGLYLEDLFVADDYRRHGVGKALLRELARTCHQRGYARMEWAVLDWNQLGIDFYRSLGAAPMEEWNLFRLTGPALAALAEG